MSNTTNPIVTSVGGEKTLNMGNPPLIMVDGHAFKFQSDADEYIRKRNAMTPAEIKKEADDIALDKSKRRQELFIGMAKSTAIVSSVPLGLAYFSYYQKYSLTKGIAVVVLGSGIAYFMAIAYAFGGSNIFSGSKMPKEPLMKNTK